MPNGRNEGNRMSRIHLLLHLLLVVVQSSVGFRIPGFGFNDSSLPQPMIDWRGQNGGVWEGFKSLVDAHRGLTNCSSLPQLKQFLHEFGYFPALDASSVFDSGTETAVKLYQKNFGLNTTGVLDEATLRQMMKPRCGREDVIDGVSVMSHNTSNSSSPGSHETSHHLRGVQHYSFFPNSPKWDAKQDLTYAIASDASTRTGISQTDLETVFADAFGEWSAVVPMNFTRVRDFSRADIKIAFATGDHGDGKPFDGVLGVLAHAFSPEDGRLHFDAAESWSLDGASAGSRSAVDLRSVAVHEIGHILGLGHSSVEGAVMFPNIGAREVKLRLSQDDVLGAQTLYGINPNYDPNSVGESGSQTENGIPVSPACPGPRVLPAMVWVLLVPALFL